MFRFLLICVIGLAASIALLYAILREAGRRFKRAPSHIQAHAPGGGVEEKKDDRPVYKTERIEKACDAVMGLVALLIPANLAIITWVYEKTHSPSYGAFLTLSTIWFLVVLFFTMYMRFNFIWGLADEIKIGVGESMKVAYWLATVMFGLSCGLLFLALSTFGIAWNMPKSTESSTPSVHVECHVDQVKQPDSCPSVDSSPKPEPKTKSKSQRKPKRRAGSQATS